MREHLEALHSQWTAEQANLLRLQRQWEMKRPAINAHIAALHEEIQRLEQEIDDILLEKTKKGSKIIKIYPLPGVKVRLSFMVQ